MSVAMQRWIVAGLLAAGGTVVRATPPTVPSITGIANNVGSVWTNGVLNTNYVKKGDYQVRWSASASTNGIKLYHLQEAGDAAFTSATQTWLLGGAYLTNRSYQQFLKTNGTNYYRIKAEAFNGETSAWSAVSNKVVNMAAPVPPTAPAITKILRNIQQNIWSNGVLVTGYVHQADFMIHLSKASSGDGVNFYEIQETTNPTNFLLGLTNNIAVVLPHFPDLEYPGATNPTCQFFLKTNATYSYRVRAVDYNGFTSPWNTIYATNALYSNITVAMAWPYPPSVPAIAKTVRNVKEDVWVNGVLQTGYVHQADYMLHLSAATSGVGVNFYEINETTNPTNFLLGLASNIAVVLPHFPDLEYPGATNPMYQFYLKTNATYSYRVRSVDWNGFASPWSTVYATNAAYSNITISVPLPVPPSKPVITSITNNIIRGVQSNGSSIVTHTNKGDYVVNVSTSASGAGVSVYEIQETQDPTNFAYVDQYGYPASWFTNPTPPAAVHSPHFPDLSSCCATCLTFASCSNPTYQFFLKTNGTYYYRVHAKDLNGFFSPWSATQSFTVAMAGPYPPAVPALASNSVTVIDGDVAVGFPPSRTGEGINVYTIELSTTADFSSGVTIVYSGVPSATFAALAAGTYYVRVSAEDWNGFKSGWSATQTVTVAYPALSNLRVTQVSNDSAVVSWNTDLPSTTEVDRRGMFRVFPSWRDPTNYVQGVLYAPAEAYGSAITTNDVDYDLLQFKTNNVNVISLYNLGWGELQQHGNVEDYIFKRAQELGIRIIVRFEVYNKYNAAQPPVGDNDPTNHFAYRPQDADRIIRYYTTNAPVLGTNGYAARYPNSILYYMINMPFDDPELRRADGIGLNDYPNRARQRAYVDYFSKALKSSDPSHRVFVNVGYGGIDHDPHFDVADLPAVDGLSVHVYTVRLDGYVRCYGYVPSAGDPDYLLMNQDVYDYYLEKNYDVNHMGTVGKPMLIDQTGYCEINDFATGLVKDKRAKARSVTLLANYLARNTRLNYGWVYFMAFDKFNQGGEHATWGLIDRLNQVIDFFDGPTTNWSPVAGSWSVTNGFCGSSGAGTEITLNDAGERSGQLEAAFNSGRQPNTNVYVILSYQDANNYRFAGFEGNAGAPRWVIGEVASGATNILASTTPGSAGFVSLAPDTEYTLRALINNNAISLGVDLNRDVVTYAFPLLTLGKAGLRSVNTPAAFDQFKNYGRVYYPAAATSHAYRLNNLFPGTDYRVRGLSGGAYSGFTNFTTVAAATFAPRASIVLETPDYSNANAAVGGTYDIRWKATDPMADARIDLFYDRSEKAAVSNAQFPANFGGRLIVSNLMAIDGVTATYTWNLAGVTSGNYYVYARIRRPGQPDEVDYSSGQLILSKKEIPALATTNAIVLDGLMSEADWAEVPWTAYAVITNGPTATVARAKMMWDSTYLYIGYDVADPQVRSGTGVADSDDIGCVIDNGKLSVNRLDVLNRTNFTDVTYPTGLTFEWGTEGHVATNASGYTAEIRIPWDTLRVIPQGNGLVPIDLLVNDRNAGGVIVSNSYDGLADETLAARSIRLLTNAAGLAPATTQIILGQDNGTDVDFASSGYEHTFYADFMDSYRMPKELNVSWWTYEDIVFTAAGSALTNGLVVTLDATWNDGSGLLNVRVDVDKGSGFATVGTVGVNSATKGVITIPASMIAAGQNTIHLTAASGSGGTTVVSWDQIKIVDAALQPSSVVLGTHNGTDTDFQSPPYGSHAFNADSQPASQMPKEVNLSWWTYEDIQFTAGDAADAQGLVVTLDPAWTDISTGFLDIAVIVNNGSLVTAAVLSVNQDTRGVALIPPSLIGAGANTIRLQAVGGINGATVITWDQIKFETPVYVTNVVAGSDNSSDAEFAQGDYDHAWLAGHMPVSNLTKEVNTSWWNWQDIDLLLHADTASRGLMVTLDPAWRDGAGLLNVEMGLDLNTEFVSVDRERVNSSARGTAFLPAALLRDGLNRIVLTATSGTSNTTVLTWDQVRVDRSSQYLLGMWDNNYVEFAANSATYTSVWNADTMPLTNLAKEISGWYTNQDIVFTLDAALASNGLLVVANPYAQDGTGALQVAVSVSTSNGWVGVGTNAISQATQGAYLVPGSLLRAGTNTLRFSKVGGTNGTTWIIWDQIRIEPAIYAGGKAIGERDGSQNDLLGDGAWYDRLFVAQSEPPSRFPRELNLTWWKCQDIALVLDATAAASGLTLSLDPYWSDGTGLLNVQVSVDKGQGFSVVTNVAVNATTPATVVLPAANLATGLNRIRLSATSGTGNTTVVTWDRVLIQ